MIFMNYIDLVLIASQKKTNQNFIYLKMVALSLMKERIKT